MISNARWAVWPHGVQHRLALGGLKEQVRTPGTAPPLSPSVESFCTRAVTPFRVGESGGLEAQTPVESSKPA